MIAIPISTSTKPTPGRRSTPKTICGPNRIKAAVNPALAAKGWTQVESGVNVSIMAMEMTQSHQTLNTYYDNFGGGWG